MQEIVWTTAPCYNGLISPMTRSALTPRRFYAAFYQWTILNNPQLCRICNSSATKHRHVSTGRQKNKIQPVQPPGKVLSQKIASFSKSQKSTAWLGAPVQSDTVLPSANLAPWQAVVRHRAGSGIVLEFAIPESAVKSLQKEYGADLEGMKSRSGASIDFGVSTTDGLCAVTFTGVVDEAMRFENTLRNSGPYRAFACKDPNSYSPSTTNISRKWIERLHLQSASSASEDSCRPWFLALRHYDANGISTIEASVPNHILEAHGQLLENYLKQEKIGFDLGKECGKENQDFSRVCTFTGTAYQLHKVHRRLKDLRQYDGSFETSLLIPSQLETYWRNESAPLRERIARETQLSELVASTYPMNGNGPFSVHLRGPRSNVLRAQQIFRAEFDRLLAMDKLPEGEQQKWVAETVKLIFRSLTHPVVVVTSKNGQEVKDKASDYNGCSGVTVSSMNTVTLEPTPILSFNLRRPSRTWDAIQASGHIRVHFLSASTKGATLADAFTHRYERSAEPFERLRLAGATIHADSDYGHKSPFIGWPGAVISTIEAKVLKESCIQIGDHVVVLAQVLTPSLSKQFPTNNTPVALAYSNRNYRGNGDKITPFALPGTNSASSTKVKVPSDNAPVFVSTSNLLRRDIGSIKNETQDEKPPYSPTINDKSHGTEYYSAPTGATAFNVEGSSLRHDDAAMSKHDLTGCNELGTPVAPRDATFNHIQNSPSGSVKSVPSTDVPKERHNTDEMDGAAILLSRLSKPHGSSMRPDTRSWNSSPSTIKVSYGRFQRRQFATKRVSPLETQSPEELVSSPAILKQTVADFLSINPDKFVRPPRMRALQKAKNDAEKASRELQLALNRASSTPESIARLEQQFVSRENMVIKKLAYQAALELRDLLDRGSVDAGRTRWLESTIEKGQAVLLEEARDLKQHLDDGRVKEANFVTKKKSLESEFEILRTETMRLKAMTYDEENVDD